MRHFIITTLIACAACKDSPPPPRNLVVESVQALDREHEIACVPYYTGEGSAVLHSARCKLPDKTFAYCRLTVDMQRMECGPLLPPNTKAPAPAPAPEQSAPATPAPSSPPPTP